MLADSIIGSPVNFMELEPEFLSEEWPYGLKAQNLVFRHIIPVLVEDLGQHGERWKREAVDVESPKGLIDHYFFKTNSDKMDAFLRIQGTRQEDARF